MNLFDDVHTITDNDTAALDRAKENLYWYELNGNTHEINVWYLIKDVDEIYRTRRYERILCLK